VLLWRRSYDVPPPPWTRRSPPPEGGPRTPALPNPSCRHRVPQRHRRAIPAVLEPPRLRPRSFRPPSAVVAHGKASAPWSKYLDGVSDTEIVDVNIPRGPLVTSWTRDCGRYGTTTWGSSRGGSARPGVADQARREIDPIGAGLLLWPVLAFARRNGKLDALRTRHRRLRAKIAGAEESRTRRATSCVIPSARSRSQPRASLFGGQTRRRQEALKTIAAGEQALETEIASPGKASEAAHLRYLNGDKAP